MNARRVLVVAGVVGLGLAMAVPALAKGAYQVTITGGGQEVTFAGSGEPNTNTVLSNFAASVKLYDGLWTEGERVAEPSGDLGPQITAVWLFIGPADDIPIVQHLYPFAVGGSVGHIPAGQVFIDDPVEEAWFPLADEFVEALGAVGFDLTVIDANAEGIVAPAAQPASVVAVAPEPMAVSPLDLVGPTTGTSWSPVWVLGLLAAIGGGSQVARWGIMRRRLRRAA